MVPSSIINRIDDLRISETLAAHAPGLDTKMDAADRIDRDERARMTSTGW